MKIDVYVASEYHLIDAKLTSKQDIQMKLPRTLTIKFVADDILILFFFVLFFRENKS